MKNGMSVGGGVLIKMLFVKKKVFSPKNLVININCVNRVISIKEKY